MPHNSQKGKKEENPWLLQLCPTFEPWLATSLDSHTAWNTVTLTLCLFTHTHKHTYTHTHTYIYFSSTNHTWGAYIYMCVLRSKMIGQFTSVFWKQTAAILDLYFRLPFQLFHCNDHVILHRAAKFHPSRTTVDGAMTSYVFFNMATTASQVNLHFPVWWHNSLIAVKV